MRVTLIDYTSNARELLIFSKKTRLKMSPNTFAEILSMSEEQKEKELDYVFGTIGSSWEFADYTFLIEGVTRAFTHQLVRHRVGVSFAQQAQRVVDMSEFEYLETATAKDNPRFKKAIEEIKEQYAGMIKDGVHPQDARGILPTNILTTILMKINLRSLSGLLNIRLCYKAQGEFQDVARAIREEALKVHPWAERVLRVHCAQNGSCAFPNYKECPIKLSGVLQLPNTDAIQTIWKTKRCEVQPKGE